MVTIVDPEFLQFDSHSFVIKTKGRLGSISLEEVMKTVHVFAIA